jgi:hypothetical protein
VPPAAPLYNICKPSRTVLLHRSEKEKHSRLLGDIGQLTEGVRRPGERAAAGIVLVCAERLSEVRCSAYTRVRESVQSPVLLFICLAFEASVGAPEPGVDLLTDSAFSDGVQRRMQ